jgi:hypothetical protein
MNDRDKDIEILVLGPQIGVLQRQLGDTRVWFSPADRALLAALFYRLPRQTLHRLRLLVRPDTILRWHRDIPRRRHAKASRPKRPGRPLYRAKTCELACELRFVIGSGGAPVFVDHSAQERWRRIESSSEITTAGSWLGGRCSRPWCGR